MKQRQPFTTIIEREHDSYVAHCPELDIASQGATDEEARRNLAEAVELFFEAADPTEVQSRLSISGAQRKELERRLACFAADPATRPWEIVKQELSNR